MLHYFIVSGFFVLFSFSALSRVGPVDDSYGKKAAACEYASESKDKTASRDVNLYGTVANVTGIAQTPSSTKLKPQQRERRRGGGSGSGSGNTR